MPFFTKFWTKPSAKLVLRVKISAHFTLPGANEIAAATNNSFVTKFASNVIVGYIEPAMIASVLQSLLSITEILG